MYFINLSFGGNPPPSTVVGSTPKILWLCHVKVTMPNFVVLSTMVGAWRSGVWKNFCAELHPLSVLGGWAWPPKTTWHVIILISEVFLHRHSGLSGREQNFHFDPSYGSWWVQNLLISKLAQYEFTLKISSQSVQCSQLLEFFCAPINKQSNKMIPLCFNCVGDNNVLLCITASAELLII